MRVCHRHISRQKRERHPLFHQYCQYFENCCVLDLTLCSEHGAAMRMSKLHVWNSKPSGRRERLTCAYKCDEEVSTGMTFSR